jgi:WD40 repeat protein
MADKQVARRVPGTIMNSNEVTSLRDLITEAAHAYELAAVTQLRAVQEAAEILSQDMGSIAEQEELATQEQARELAAAQGALAAEETRAQVLAHLAAEAREAAATLLDRGALAYLRGTGDTLTGAVQQHTAPDELAAAAFADAQKARIDLRIALLKIARAHFDARDWARARDVVKSLADSASGPLTREFLVLLHATYLEQAVTASSADWEYSRASMAAAMEISHGLTADHELAKQFLDATTRLVESAQATGRIAEALSLLALAREHLGVEHPEWRHASLLARAGARLAGSCLQEFGGHRQPVQDVAFTPDGEQVVSVDGNDIKRWRTSSDGPGGLVATFPAQRVFRLARDTSLAATTSGSLLSTADGTNASQLGRTDTVADGPQRVPFNTAERAAKIPPPRALVHKVAAFSSSADNSVTAWAHRTLAEETVNIYGISNRPIQQSFGDSSLGPLQGASIPPQWPLNEAFNDNQYWPVNGHDSRLGVPLYPLAQVIIERSTVGQAAQPISDGQKPILLSLVVSATGRFLAWLNPFGELAVVDTATAVTRYTFHVARSQTICDAVEISPRDEMVLAAQGQTVTAWDIATGARSFTLTFPGVIGAIAISPNGRMLATLSIKGDISLCDIKKQPSPVVIGNHGPVTSPCIAFSPDGARLVTSGDHVIKVWSLA